MEGSSRRIALPLAAIAAVGLVARLPRLLESLWYDEIAAWHDYGRLGNGPGGPGAILSTYDDPANHLLHTFLSWLSMERLGGLLGEETALRAPALVFSLAAIPVLALLGRRAGGTRTGLLAGGLAAIAPVAVLEGADARGYSMMIFFSALSAWLLLAALDRRSGRGRTAVAALSGAAVALAVWSHLMSVFAGMGQALVLAGRAAARRDRAALVVAAAGLGAAALATLAMLAPVLDDLVRVARRFGAAEEGAPSALGPEGAGALLQLGGSWSWWAALPGLALAAAGAARARRTAEVRAPVLLLLAGLPLLPAAALLGGSWMYARFALFALPGGLLLVALGLDALWERRRAAGAAALVILATAWSADLLLRPPRQPLREAAAFVRERGEPGARVLVIGLRLPVMDVYAGALDLRHSPDHGADLPAHLAGDEPEWVIVLYPRSVPEERHEALRAAGFVRAARLRGWIDGGNGDVLVLRRVAPGRGRA